MDNNQWEPKRRIEHQLQRSLSKVGESMLESIEGLTDPFEITTVIRSWLKNMVFHHYAEKTAESLVTTLLKTSATTWRMAARENSNGRVIYDALRKELQGPVGSSVAFQINRNAEIIKSMPLDIARQVTNYISDEAINGRRSEDIADDIRAKFPSITRNKAALIARSEVSKTSTALTRSRSESINIPAYTWRTSEDGRVRKSHRHMDGVIVFWSDPPAPEALISVKSTLGKYHAGEAPNCRCYPEPVVNLDYIKWPVKVYRGGSITMMTRIQFERIA
ncbi:phage head morphogenesis protein [Desulfosporosinus fructosivorans]|uniref:Phage head morphogenesis protein n=1 Tax=Desulfosporosinus fructosivorans TaxID=2018669 RepID=A0A4Z0R1L8_9FIRM|nr:phage minor head protein [Desulfosporosinus fructosivorans]TGE35887.1 phage head morphogenesis protein [Desulfosporosinus fructosivorans]